MHTSIWREEVEEEEGTSSCCCEDTNSSVYSQASHRKRLSELSDVCV